DRVNHPCADGHFFRVGYRTEGTDHILTAVDLPIHVLEQEIASGLELSVTLAPSGELTFHIVGSSGLSLLRSRSIAPMHQLISEAVSSDNLRLEEASTDELCGLLKTLESAIGHVRTALALVRSEP